MGSGQDTIIGGAGVEKVVDKDGGGDTYHLNAGNDILVAWGVNAAGSLYDGGLGFDTIDFSNSATAVTMDETLHTLNFGGGNSTVMNFENIIGSANADNLKGSVTADYIHGGAGDDKISGGGGADQLWGDGGANTFIYGAITDSTNATAGRDTIHDFKQGIDHIQLLFDTNTILAGTQHVPSKFTVNGAFTHTAGELREVFVGTQTILQIDTHGTGIADFAIAFDGHLTFSASDFIL